MITAEQVKKLNKRIEKLNADGTRARAKLEVLESNLNQAIADYMSAYGVDLRGKSMKEVAVSVKKELQSVEATVDEEYRLRSQVVDAIERGDIDQANRLLGVEEPAEEEEDAEAGDVMESVDDVESAVDDSDADDFGDDLGDFGDSGELDDDSDDGELDVSIDIEDDDFGLGDVGTSSKEPTKSTPKAASTPKKSKTKGNSSGVSVEETVQELDGFQDFDDSDDDDDDFGFGEMLAGSKFDI